MSNVNEQRPGFVSAFPTAYCIIDFFFAWFQIDVLLYKLNSPGSIYPRIHVHFALQKPVHWNAV